VAGRRFQIKKLQREHTIELASRDEQLDGLRAQLELARNSSDSSIEAEFAALQRLYAHPFRCPRHCCLPLR
jgi:serine/threonine-protein kinase RIO1